jgi:probable F420-dependent oxidoreductase
MRIGLVIPNTGVDAVDAVRRLPAEAERLGYDDVWVTDHVVGVRSLAPTHGPVWAEALTCLAYMAATTSRVRLGVGVLVVPYRQPVLAAKILATIDHLSGGRLDVGIAAGWARSEFHALGQGEHFESRGRVTDQRVELMLRCWEGGEFGWDSDVAEFRRMEFAPTPLQSPHPPLWSGGHNPTALRRAARFADVWHPSGVDPAELEQLGRRLDDLAGRPVARSIRLRIPPGEVGDLPDLLDSYAQAGCIAAAVEFTEVDTWDGVRRAAEGLAAALRTDLRLIP